MRSRPLLRRPSTATEEPFANSLATKRRGGPSGRRIVYLTEKDIAYALHTLALMMFPEDTYGEPMPHFQLRGREGLELLEAAVAVPRYPYLRTKHEKAAALFRSMIKNHALIDGNKRLAVVALSVFLAVNRVDFKVSTKNMVETALAVAAYPGNFPMVTLTKWIRANCVGRPKSIVATLAEDWPEARRVFAARARIRDVRAGRPARLPGRRLRYPPHIWEAASRVVEAKPRQLRLDL
jgi:death-on-curing family protein